MDLEFIKRWTAWLLPLIVLQALVPPGFMLGADRHGLQLIFCPGVVHHGGQHQTNENLQVGTHDHDTGHGGSSYESSVCPSALIGAANCHVIPDIAADLTATDESFTLPRSPVLGRTLIRAQRIRGPPGRFLEH